METPSDLRQVYRELADNYERLGQSQFRDRFLVLAASASFSAGDVAAAESYRQRLLRTNPHHLLKPYASFAQAMETTDIQLYIRDLQQNYPADVAQGLLNSQSQVVASPAEQLVPVTAPEINFNGSPDLLMEDDGNNGADSLKIYSLSKEEPSSAVPPTLPTLEPLRPITSIPPRRSKPPRVNPPAAGPQPVQRPTQQALWLMSTPRPERATHKRREQEAELAGAWLPALLFGVLGVVGIALAFYTLIQPFTGQP